jgi:hypothetical protein
MRQEAEATRAEAERTLAKAQAAMQTTFNQSDIDTQVKQLEATKASYLSALRTAYPEAQSEETLARLAYSDPAKYKSFVDDYTRLDADYRAKENFVIGNHAAHLRQFNEAAQRHDAVFSQNHPELYGPKAPKGAPSIFSK